MKTVAYYRPRTLEEAWKLHEAHAEAGFIAGGTDLMVGNERPPVLVSLRAIPGLDGIEVGDTTRVGGMTLVRDLLGHPEIAREFPVLIEATRDFASVQIRNAATVGGNLCNASPAADLAPPLIVLGARARLVSSAGARVVDVENLITGPGRTCLEPGEVLAELQIDRPPPGTRATYLRKTRVRMDIALASAAVLLGMEGNRCRTARVAVGAVAAVPLRLPAVEALLENEQITPGLVTAAAELAARIVTPIDDVRTTAKYRRRLVSVYVKRGLQRLLGWGKE